MGPSRSGIRDSQPSYTILIVDDQPEALTATGRLLEREGHTVLCASTGKQAVALAAEHNAQVILVDYMLPDMTGAEVIEQIRNVDDLAQIIVQTGFASTCPPRELLRTLAIQGYHDKTDGPDKLLQWIDVACRAYTVLERSRRSENLKVQLVANVSHELRTPLNVILGYIELMRDGVWGSQTPQSTEALVTIHRQALILLHLINDLLDMSKLQAGAMQFARERVNVSSIVDEFRDALPILVSGADIDLRWDMRPDVYAMVDPGKVRVIVQNLVSNAAKFTMQGEIAICVRVDSANAYVTVCDTGAGIRPEDQQRIFELFEQAENAGGRREAGTGIGLYLSRCLARLMGGDLTVESALGAGSTFSLRLPVAA
jgi:signal transduction histidine kinase